MSLEHHTNLKKPMRWSLWWWSFYLGFIKKWYMASLWWVNLIIDLDHPTIRAQIRLPQKLLWSKGPDYPVTKSKMNSNKYWFEWVGTPIKLSFLAWAIQEGGRGCRQVGGANRWWWFSHLAETCNQFNFSPFLFFIDCTVISEPLISFMGII